MQAQYAETKKEVRGLKKQVVELYNEWVECEATEVDIRKTEGDNNAIKVALISHKNEK